MKNLLFSLIFMMLVTTISFADFTLGVYCVKNPKDLQTIKDAGFNAVQTYYKDPKIIYNLAVEAKKLNMTLLAYPNKFFNSTFANQVKDLPIIWYLFDEPDVWNIDRIKVESVDEKTRKTFAGSKTALVVGQANTKENFYDITDIFMLDWYPVPHLPLESFGQQILSARQKLNRLKNENAQLWGVVQMFDWAEEKNLTIKDKSKLRFPTKNEIRFMSYDALFKGATGLFYFKYTYSGKPLPQSNPKVWKEIKKVIQELSFTTKIFSEGTPICNPTCNGKTVFCSICNKRKTFKVTGNEQSIDIKSFEYNDKKYTFLINDKNYTQEIPEPFFDKKYKVLFSKYTSLYKLKRSGIKMKPYSTLVFEYK